jgi:hypothetical protein
MKGNNMNTNLTTAQIAINISFSGLNGFDAVMGTVIDVTNAYYDDKSLSTTAVDLAHALYRGESVLRGEGRTAEADLVKYELNALYHSNVLTVGDMMNAYEELTGNTIR